MAKNKFSIEESLAELAIDLNQMTKEIESRAKSALQILAMQTHGKIVEMAQNKLRSTRGLYLESLGVTQQGDSMWLITLDKKAKFIEEGLKGGDMRPDIIHGGKPPKISKKGFAYKVIPFQHNKSPQNMSLAQMRVANYAKAEIKRQGLDKTIMGSNGKPALGRVATLDLTGPKAPVNKHNVPILKGLTIYQSQTKSGKIKRDVFSFRVISDKTRGDGTWERPEKEGVEFFDKVSKDLEMDWDKIITEIVQAIGIDTRGGA